MNKTLHKIDKLLADAIGELQALTNDRESQFSDKSEKWQESDNGTEFQSATDSLNEVLSQLEDAQTTIQGLLT
jgi:uncharacterized protein